MKQRLTMALPISASLTLPTYPSPCQPHSLSLFLALSLSLLPSWAFPAVSVHLNALLVTQIALSEATIKLELNLVRFSLGVCVLGRCGMYGVVGGGN